jgi:hypothetical protein
MSVNLKLLDAIPAFAGHGGLRPATELAGRSQPAVAGGGYATSR